MAGPPPYTPAVSTPPRPLSDLCQFAIRQPLPAGDAGYGEIRVIRAIRGSDHSRPSAIHTCRVRPTAPATSSARSAVQTARPRATQAKWPLAQTTRGIAKRPYGTQDTRKGALQFAPQQPGISGNAHAPALDARGLAWRGWGPRGDHGGAPFTDLLGDALPVTEPAR